MIDFFQAILDFRFMQFALLACLLASVGCGIIGSFVVVKRVGSLAGGIAHAVLAGMGIAFFFGGSPMIGATVMALLSAFLIAHIKFRWKQDEDILIAAFWSVGMAVGVLFISQTPNYNINLMSYLFGNILLVSGLDLVRMLVLDIVIIIFVKLFYQQFLAAAFDEEYARLRGVNVELFDIIMLSMIALTVVLLVQIVGLILVIALLVLPAATAAQFSHSLTRMMFIAVILSIVQTFTGLAISYQPDLPSGAVMIVLAGIIYIISIAIKSRLKLAG